MAYTKEISDCNTYFGATNHVQAYTWDQYEDNEKSGAFAQAKRELEVYLGRDLTDPSSSDKYRDDYAHFEQTLFLLEQTMRTRQAETGAELIETVDTEQRDKYYGVTISPMAMRYLAIPRVRDFRGLDTDSFDGSGNYSMGLTEQSVFPEIKPAQIESQQGMNITFVTTANTDDEARRMLSLFGMPFKKPTIDN